MSVAVLRWGVLAEHNSGAHIIWMVVYVGSDRAYKNAMLCQQHVGKVVIQGPQCWQNTSTTLSGIVMFGRKLYCAGAV
eukprot:719971-Pelagomonas_calceolata.AAC.3